mgnify:CR=1 FL=1
MLAAHLGVVDEECINNMAYVFFDDVLRELGYRLNYEAIVNYAGNSFCERSWDMIQRSNPFNVADPNDRAQERRSRKTPRRPQLKNARRNSFRRASAFMEFSPARGPAV